MLKTKFKRKSDSILTFLHNNYQPFNRLMVVTLLRANDAIRTIKMRKGEEFSMIGSNIPDYLYVIQGKIEVTKEDNYFSIDAIDDLGSLNFFPANQKPMSIKAISDSTIVQVDSEMLSELISWNELALNSGLFDSAETEKGLACIHKTKAFRKLPIESLNEVLNKFERIEVSKGDEVITQGIKGDAFYLIISGEAEVWRQGLYDEEQKNVATLKSGDSFGEEALIIKGTRNASVKMTTDGVLFKLNEKDFDELLATPLIKQVPSEIAYSMLQNGYQLLDVRYEEEFDDSYVPGAKLLPLPDIRERLEEVSSTEKYIIICAAGKRASVAALLLRQHDINEVHVVEGGMRDWPYEKSTNY